MYTALVVDDDPLVLEVLSKMLAEPGYAVITANDGYEAIRILADRHIDLMIADIRMPGLDGMQLGIQAKLMRPRLHIIYITGFAEAAAKAQYGKVIQKPIRASELLEIVKKEIAA
jgi:CheY-like chemotaxis protein